MIVLPPRLSSDSVRIEAAARRAGVAVVRLPGWRVPSGLVGNPRVTGLYAEPLYADVVAGPLGLALLEAPLDWLVSCPADLRRRDVHASTLADAREQLSAPAFVKACDDKSVRPRVYASGDDLPGEPEVAGTTPVLVQGPLRFVAEYRFFCLDGVPVTGSRYAVDGALAEAGADGPEGAAARSFTADALTAVGSTLPVATVLDVGLLDDGAWAVVEANAAWGSGLYGCDEHRALPVVQASARRHTQVRPGERRFVRDAPDVRW